MNLKFIPVLALLLAAQSPRAQAQSSFVAHEWGTFTSVQGGDGVLLSWHPLRTSELPGFVYNWTRPGLGRILAGFLAGGEPFRGKGFMTTLQRLETPVLYFYSEQTASVDVSVGFPQGLITEWYPQASQIGPSKPAGAGQAGPSTALPESRAVWRNLVIRPPGRPVLPRDASGSHYYAARETSADVVQMSWPGSSNAVSESDKFIFYRGAGSFKTPLRVTVDAKGMLSVENTGKENLAHLFVVSIHHGRGAFAEMPTLAGGASACWVKVDSLAAEPGAGRPLSGFQAELGVRVEAALASEGLFADEAKAMVKTWADSWFTEEGERVLYVLPRGWTDEILPLTLTPAPAKLVRVMVGRAELITPAATQHLAQALTQAKDGHAAARQQAAAALREFGRFAEPALQLANRPGSQTNLLEFGYQLLRSTGGSGG